MREEKDFAQAQETYENDATIEIEPWAMSVDHLRLMIHGIPDTPYDGGTFEFEMKLPPNYPFAPPFAYCSTLIWHPNIDSSIPAGNLNICLDLINPDLVGKVDAGTGASGWTPAKTLVNVIEALKGQIHCEPPFFNPSDPLNHEAGEQALHAYKKFAKKASDWTKQYAM